MKMNMRTNAIAAFIMLVALLWSPVPGNAGMGQGPPNWCELNWDCDVEGVGDEERCNEEALEASENSNYDPEYKGCGACVWLCRLDEYSVMECCAQYWGDEFWQCHAWYYEQTANGDWRVGECSIIPVYDECVLTTGVCWELEPPPPGGGGGPA